MGPRKLLTSGKKKVKMKRKRLQRKKSNYPKLHVQTNGRVVAIGDLHGDIQQARRALRIAGVLGKDDDDNVNPQWVGGDTGCSCKSGTCWIEATTRLGF